MPDSEPETFHHYRVLRREDGTLWVLGRGAMGVTYKAEDTNLRNTVALKVINSAFLNNDTARERFVREARAAASLRHRNVAAVYHLGQDAQSYFYAMEFIDGYTIEQLIDQNGPQPWRVALPYALQVTRALMAAHDKQLVHRDIKPANLMLVAEAGEDELVIKVIDFGLAKSLIELGGGIVNISGSGFIGTPLYASPEQCEEIAPDIRSDMYSLGVVLWFVLTGKPLFNGPLGRVFAQHISAKPPWKLLPVDLPGGVRVLLARMLAKDRAHRPQTPAVLRREIEACLRPASEAITAAPFVVRQGASLAEPVREDAATLLEPTINLPGAGTMATLMGVPVRDVSQHTVPLPPTPVVRARLTSEPPAKPLRPLILPTPYLPPAEILTAKPLPDRRRFVGCLLLALLPPVLCIFSGAPDRISLAFGFAILKLLPVVFSASIWLLMVWIRRVYCSFRSPKVPPLPTKIRPSKYLRPLVRHFLSQHLSRKENG